MKTTTILHTIVALLILLFLYAAISKLLDYHSFAFQLSRSPVIKNVAGIIAWLLPLVELVTVLLLLTPRLQLIGLYTSCIMLVCFTIYISLVLAFAKNIPCSCGGILQGFKWHEHLAFNSIFILLTIIGIIYNKRSQRPNNKSFTGFRSVKA